MKYIMNSLKTDHLNAQICHSVLTLLEKYNNSVLNEVLAIFQP